MKTASRFRPWVSALAVTLIISLGHAALWSWLQRPATPPDWQGQIGGFAFSAFQRDQSPLERQFPSAAQIESDIALLARYSSRIRSYASAESDSIPRLAEKYGLDLTAGAWLNQHPDDNQIEMDALIATTRQFRSISRVIVGNEAVLRSELTPQQLIAYLERARSELTVPVSTAEPWHIWLQNPELAEHVDFITVHLLPYWEGVSGRNGVDYVLHQFDELRRQFPDKPIVIGEVGWPSNGNRVRNARASTADAARFVREFLPVAELHGFDYYLMEAFDQPWKEASEGRVGAYWGLFNAARELKFPLTGPVPEDASWRIKALSSGLLALLPLLLFAWRFAHLRWWGRLFYAGLIQAGCALLLWSASLPLEFYLDAMDWLMLLVLLPAQLAILAIVLILGFEFVETLAQPQWRRHFSAKPASAGAALPRVSIHVPCHNEPPDLVIQTLNSLAALDYPDFEVLVIDNNTGDPAVWTPLREHCETLGERFRFFHLDNWQGFKAGALNFALDQADPRASIVAVVDSDYVVEPSWLSSLIGHFERDQVAIVQAPQAHRHWSTSLFQRVCNWEYEGFFRIGMHHRNERDAIIQHGTMTLIRRAVLEQLRWAEWCICEDAELGLRVLQGGSETVYVDRVLGRGLTPADFLAYKSQRFRWAFGAMQILRRHSSSFFLSSKLDLGQRYHFLTGWFSWFGDALHLIFTGLVLLWTAGMVLSPKLISLPHALFMVPALSLFTVKVMFGLVLYRARVPCTWRDTFGAALANMSLSHTIARAVLRGLVTKDLPFARTAKRRPRPGLMQSLGSVSQELGLLGALWLALLAVSSLPGFWEGEGRLWVCVLIAQSLPYLAAAWVALQSSRQPALPVQSGVHTGN